jgi:antitoxin PrlF
MTTLLMSSKGQFVLPAALRKRLGLHAGSRLEVLEEADGLRLRVVRAMPHSDVAALAGMVQLAATGQARSLDNFDPASLLAGARRRDA